MLPPLVGCCPPDCCQSNYCPLPQYYADKCSIRNNQEGNRRPMEWTFVKGGNPQQVFLIFSNMNKPASKISKEKKMYMDKRNTVYFSKLNSKERIKNYI